MATFNASKGKMILNKSEKLLLEKSMSDFVKDMAAQNAANLLSNFEMRKKLRKPMLASIERKVGKIEEHVRTGSARLEIEREKLRKKLAAKTRLPATRLRAQ